MQKRGAVFFEGSLESPTALRRIPRALAKPPPFNWGSCSLSTSWQRTLLALGPISLGRSQPGNKRGLSPPPNVFWTGIFFLGRGKLSPVPSFLLYRELVMRGYPWGGRVLASVPALSLATCQGISDGYLTHPDCCQSRLLTLQQTWAADPNPLSGPD